MYVYPFACVAAPLQMFASRTQNHVVRFANERIASRSAFSFNRPCYAGALSLPQMLTHLVVAHTRPIPRLLHPSCIHPSCIPLFTCFYNLNSLLFFAYPMFFVFLIPICVSHTLPLAFCVSHTICVSYSSCIYRLKPVSFCIFCCCIVYSNSWIHNDFWKVLQSLEKFFRNKGSVKCGFTTLRNMQDFIQ